MENNADNGRTFAQYVGYWQACVAAGDLGLQEELPNIHYALEQGLTHPRLWEASTGLLVDMLPIVERGGYGRDWLPLVEQALDANREEPLLLCRLYAMQGVLERALGNLSAARTAHENGMAWAHYTADAHLIARSHFHLAGTLRDQGEYAQANNHARQALTLWRPDEKKWLAATLNTLGRIAQAQGQYPQAEGWLQQAVTFSRAVGQPLELARTLNNLALAQQAQKHWDDAATSYAAALALFDPTHYLLDYARTTISLGSLFFDRKKYGEAESLLRTINVSDLRQAGFTYQEAMVTQNLGNTLLKLQHYSEAEAYTRYALELWERLHNPIMGGNSFCILAEIALAQGQTDRARALHDQALHQLAPYIGRDAIADEVVAELRREVGAKL